MKFSIKDFFSKCDQILRKLRIWTHLLKKFLMEKFVFCAMIFVQSVLINKMSFRNSKLKARAGKEKI